MRGRPMTIWAAIAALVAAAAIVVFMMRRNRAEKFVLGQQMADAHANEAGRLTAGNDGSSPMPEGQYDQEKGDDDLTSVAEVPLDKELQGLVRAFATWAPEKRAEARRRISMDEQYMLVQFARRSSVLALREKSIVRCEDGLLALAMIDEARIDPRDASWAVGLLAHAIEATGADRKGLVSRATALATPGMATILMAAGEGSQLSDWGYAEIRTEDNDVGLVRSGFARYEPTVDMTRLALRLAAILRRGRYVAEPELAAELPAVWFEKAGRPSAEQLLEKARGAISVRGTLRRAHTENPSAQMFVQWVVEMPSAQEANALVEHVGSNARRDSHFVIGVASGRLFSLLVAGSSEVGVEPFESPESLAAVVKETRPLLDEASR